MLAKIYYSMYIWVDDSMVRIYATRKRNLSTWSIFILRRSMSSFGSNRVRNYVICQPKSESSRIKEIDYLFIVKSMFHFSVFPRVLFFIIRRVTTICTKILYQIDDQRCENSIIVPSMRKYIHLVRMIFFYRIGTYCLRANNYISEIFFIIWVTNWFTSISVTSYIRKFLEL